MILVCCFSGSSVTPSAQGFGCTSHLKRKCLQKPSSPVTLHWGTRGNVDSFTPFTILLVSSWNMSRHFHTHFLSPLSCLCCQQARGSFCCHMITCTPMHFWQLCVTVQQLGCQTGVDSRNVPVAEGTTEAGKRCRSVSLCLLPATGQ